MYEKITVLIATDIVCWFPVCIMTFLSMSGVVLDPLAYAVSAIVLLPMNSSLNPIIYATPLSAVKKSISDWRKKLRERRRSTPSKETARSDSAHVAGHTEKSVWFRFGNHRLSNFTVYFAVICEHIILLSLVWMFYAFIGVCARCSKFQLKLFEKASLIQSVSYPKVRYHIFLVQRISREKFLLLTQRWY